MLFLKLFHASYQSLHAALRHRVIKRGTETTYRTVSLDTYHTSGSSIFTELVLQLLILIIHHETNIHDRTIFLRYRTTEQLIAIDLIV